jgi:hypothetical protein
MITLPNRLDQLYIVSINAEGILQYLTGIEGPWVRRSNPESVSDIAFFYTCDDKDGYLFVKGGYLTVMVNGEVLYDGLYQTDPTLEKYIVIEPEETDIPLEWAA